jgi:diguanylate cyclase (GGDEF)-like protein
MTYQTHIRQVLAPSIMAVQWLTIAIWLATLLLNPHLQRPLDHAYALAFTVLLGTAASSALARRFWQWRLSGALYVLALALAYRLELHGMGRHGEFWLLPVSVTLCLGVNLLFLFSRDYLLVLACTWSIMLVAHPAPVPARSDLSLLALLVTAVSLIGFALNRMFLRSMRTTFALQEDYRRISETDALTGLANRRALTAQLQTLAAARGTRALHFAMLDIDDFKQVNDRYGHDVGDAVLLALAAELARLGSGCRVGRLGGEEFGILFERMSDAQVGDLLHGLLDRVCRLRVGEVAFAFSAGVARLPSGGTVPELLKRADRALYAAKREGKGRIRIETGAGAAPANRGNGADRPLPPPSA